MKNNIGLILALVVGVIMVGSLLAPVVSSMSSETLICKNEGTFFAAPDDGEHTIVFSEDYITVDDVNIDYPEGYGTGLGKNATVAFGDDWMLRLDSGLARLVLAGPSNGFKNFGVADGITLTLNGSTLTYTISGTDYTLSDTQYYISSEGDMVMCYNPYITADDSLIVGGIRNDNNDADADIFEIVSGTVDDGFTATGCRVLDSEQNDLTITSSTFSTATETVSGELLQLDKITQEITLSDSSTATLYLSYLLAPYEVEYDNPNYIGSSVAGILSAITVIVIVALVVVAARGMLNDD